VAGTRRGPVYHNESRRKHEAADRSAVRRCTVRVDDRNKFMSTCLKGGQPMTQQEKMAACNKEASAKAMRGDDRKKFMSSCLSG
jgi:hypothetical protein